MMYQQSVSVAQCALRLVTEADRNICAKDCVEGCFCPDDKALDNDGYCIDPSKCLSEHNISVNDLTFIYRMS